MEPTKDTKEIVDMVSKLPQKEMTVLKAFIAGMEAKEKLEEKKEAV